IHRSVTRQHSARCLHSVVYVVISEREHSAEPTSWRARVAELTGLRGARLNPGWERLRALSIAAVVVAMISGLVGWRSRPQQAAPPVTPAPHGSASSSVGSSGQPVASLRDLAHHPPADPATA